MTQLDAHMLKSQLCPSHQTAYRKYQLGAMGHRRCNVLVLLDQSTAFDTVNQGLLVNRLQPPFGICNNTQNE